MSRSHVRVVAWLREPTYSSGILMLTGPVWYSRVAWAKANMHTFVALMNGPLPHGFPPVQTGGMRLSG